MKDVYAPTNASEEEVMEEFYVGLDEAVGKTVLIVLYV